MLPAENSPGGKDGRKNPKKPSKKGKARTSGGNLGAEAGVRKDV